MVCSNPSGQDIDDSTGSDATRLCDIVSKPRPIEREKYVLHQTIDSGNQGLVVLGILEPATSNLHESSLLFRSEMLSFFGPSFLVLGELSVIPGFLSPSYSSC